MARPSARLRRTIPWALRRDRGAATQAIMRRSRGAIALNHAGRDRGFSATPANSAFRVLVNHGNVGVFSNVPLALHVSGRHG